MQITFKLRIVRSRLLILLLLLSTTATAADLPIVVCVLVKHAQIARLPLARESSFGHANAGHQIAVGAHSVLAIRVFENAFGPPDSQHFRKATLEFKLPAIQSGKRAIVKVFRSYYSEGASAWVTTAGYSWASDPFHEVLLYRDRNGLNVNLKLTIETTAEWTRAGRQPKKRIHVEHQCLLQQQTVADLTPWTGKVGTTPDSFYSPYLRVSH